jgi:glycosyltransferase involved in cell wall biosynthesis
VEQKHILFISYYWPPAGGVSVQRPLKIARLLPQYNYLPVVIAPKDGAYPFYDESLLNEIPDSVEVHKTFSLEPFALYNFLKGKKGKSMPLVAVTNKKEKTAFQKLAEYIRANYFIPDARVGWVPFAFKEARQILKTRNIVAVITTGPPHSTHLTGLRLKEEFGLPWIADFRDPWSTILYNEFLPRTVASRKKDSELETRVLRHADVVTVITRGMKEEFEDRAKRIEVIYNGFDENDFSPAVQGSSSFFSLRHTGSFNPLMNSIPLWKAISDLCSSSTTFKNLFRLEFTGNVDASVKQSIQEAGIESNVVYQDFVPHKEAIKLMQDASCNLLVLSDVKGAGLLLTGKVFEYLATQRPILSIGIPGGNADELLQKGQRLPMHAFDNKEGIKQTLLNLFNSWLDNDKHSELIANDYHLQFTRNSQAKAFARLLDDISLNNKITA